MNNWPIVKFGEVLSLDLDRVEIDPTIIYPMIGVYSFGRGLFDREPVHGGNTSYRNFYRLRADHIVMSQLFGWEGALALSSTEFSGKFVSPQFPTFVANEEKLDRRYLGWYIRRPPFWEELGTRTRGMGDRRRTLNPDALFSCEIPLPPLSEQRRIVAKIEQLAAKIEEARGLRQRTDEAKDVFIAAVTTEIFQELNGSPRVRIGELGENSENPIQIGPFGAQLHRSEFTEKGIPVLNVGNVWPEGLRLDRLDHVNSEKAGQLKRYSLKPDDLLFARSGATLGKVCIVPKECDGWLMTGHLFRVRFDQQRCDPWFAFAALRGARSVRGQVFDQVRGATRPGFNTTLLSNVELPVPPLSEQRRIVAYLDGLQAQVDRLKALQAQTAAELEALLPSILDKAFKGEL